MFINTITWNQSQHHCVNKMLTLYTFAITEGVIITNPRCDCHEPKCYCHEPNTILINPGAIVTNWVSFCVRRHHCHDTTSCCHEPNTNLMTTGWTVTSTDAAVTSAVTLSRTQVLGSMISSPLCNQGSGSPGPSGTGGNQHSPHCQGGNTLPNSLTASSPNWTLPSTPGKSNLISQCTITDVLKFMKIITNQVFMNSSL